MLGTLTKDLLELTAEAKGVRRPAFAMSTSCCCCCSSTRPPNPL